MERAAAAASRRARLACAALTVLGVAVGFEHCAAETVFITRELQPFRLFQAEMQCNASESPAEPEAADQVRAGVECVREWDTIGCWPSTPAGSVRTISCPNYVNKFETEASTSRRCLENGTWQPFPTKNRTLVLTERYKPCFGKSWTAVGAIDVPSVIKDHLPRVMLIYDVGYSISIVALLASIFIMISLKKLRCPRNTVHTNLFLSFALRAAMTLLKSHLFVDQNALRKDLIEIRGKLFFNPNDTHWECKTLTTAAHYAAAASFMWIFMEGLYLHRLIFSASFSDSSSVLAFVVAGWASPLLYIIPYTFVRIYLDDNECWNNFINRDLRWIIDGPMVLTVVVNFVFFLNIIRVLFTKLHASNAREARKYRYIKLAKSTLVLIPLFGVHWIVFLTLDIYTDVNAEVVRFYFDTFFTSFQGFMVSLLFCFLNGEVQAEMKKKWSLIQMDCKSTKHKSRTQQTSQHNVTGASTANQSPTAYLASQSPNRMDNMAALTSDEQSKLMTSECP